MKQTFSLTRGLPTRLRRPQSCAKPDQSVGQTKVRTACGSGRVDLAKDCGTTVEKFEFGLAEISFMGEVTAGRVIFGPDNVEPLLGVTALESVGITIDPRGANAKAIAR